MPDLLSAGLLLKLDVTVWTGTPALSAPDLGLDPASIAAHYMLGRKRLVPKPSLDPVAGVVRQARYALESLSHPLPDGSRFVLEATAPKVEAQLRRGQARFEAAVAAFLEAYPAHRAAMAAEWEAVAPAAWRTAGRPGDEAAFVTATELRRKFEFFWWTYTLRLHGTERIGLAGVADAERARRVRDGAYRAEVEARIGAALERSLAGFRAQVAETCRAVLAHIQSGHPLREGTVERLRRTIRRFRALDFVDHDALAGELAAFEQVCLEGLDPAAVQGAPDVRALLTAGLQAVVEAATTARPRSALTGRALRRFDVEAPAEDGIGEPEGSRTPRDAPTAA